MLGPLRLCRLDSQRIGEEPGDWSALFSSEWPRLGSRARKRDAGATRGVVAGTPLGAAWRDTAPLGRS